jgi:hypothetical protein
VVFFYLIEKVQFFRWLTLINISWNLFFLFLNDQFLSFFSVLYTFPLTAFCLRLSIAAINLSDEASFRFFSESKSFAVCRRI